MLHRSRSRVFLAAFRDRCIKAHRASVEYRGARPPIPIWLACYAETGKHRVAFESDTVWNMARPYPRLKDPIGYAGNRNVTTGIEPPNNQRGGRVQQSGRVHGYGRKPHHTCKFNRAKSRLVGTALWDQSMPKNPKGRKAQCWRSSPLPD